MSILFVRIAKGCLYLGVGAPRGIRYASVGRQTVEVETRNGPWRKSGTFFSAKGFGKRVGFVRVSVWISEIFYRVGASLCKFFVVE
eukprot:678987-Amorphochlora_amoeboformis.AAC.1